MCRLVILCFLFLTLKHAQGQTTPVAQSIVFTGRRDVSDVKYYAHIKFFPVPGLANNGTLPVNAYVEGCLQTPCVLHQLEDAVIHVVFEAPYLLHNMTTKALAIVNFIFPIEVNYNLGPNAVTCNFLTNTYCPILKNEVVQYTLNMFIESFFTAGITATIEFRVEDENEKSIWCIRLPIRITGPRQLANINQQI